MRIFLKSVKSIRNEDKYQNEVKLNIKMDISMFAIVVVDLFLNCLFMIMKLVACVTFPDGGRIRDGCLLLGQSQ